MDAHPALGEAQATLEAIAAQHNFSLEAVQTVWRSLAAGGGTMAQFYHPELGGVGQWTQGGMIMIGDMFNHALKTRVDSLCSDLARLAQEQQTRSKNPPFTSQEDVPFENWWEADLGFPAASGSQNHIRYAYFPATKRLAILQGSDLTVYDTGNYQITGTAQQQSFTGTLTLTSQLGSVRLSDLSVVSTNTQKPTIQQTDDDRTPSPELTPESFPCQTEQEPSAEIFYKIERLAELRDKGVLSEEEFLLKKTELLAKL